MEVKDVGAQEWGRGAVRGPEHVVRITCVVQVCNHALKRMVHLNVELHVANDNKGAVTGKDLCVLEVPPSTVFTHTSTTGNIKHTSSTDQ